MRVSWRNVRRVAPIFLILAAACRGAATNEGETDNANSAAPSGGEDAQSPTTGTDASASDSNPDSALGPRPDGGLAPPPPDGGSPPLPDGGTLDGGPRPDGGAMDGGRFDAGSDGGSCFGTAPPTGSGQAEGKVSGTTSYTTQHSGNFTSISGDSAAVGHQGLFGSVAGSVTVSRWDHCNAKWTLEQTISEPLSGPDTGVQDMFGSSVSLENDTLAVGANYKDLGFGSSGKLFVFSRSGTTWTKAQEIYGPTGAYGARFAFSIAQANATTMAVGAPLGKDPSSLVSRTGAMAVYRRA